MVVVYKKHEFKVYAFKKSYIIHNTKKDFEIGHTHINNYNTAKYIVNLAVHKSIPNRKKEYFYESLIRISNDHRYIEKLRNEMEQFSKYKRKE